MRKKARKGCGTTACEFQHVSNRQTAPGSRPGQTICRTGHTGDGTGHAERRCDLPRCRSGPIHNQWKTMQSVSERRIVLPRRSPEGTRAVRPLVPKPKYQDPSTHDIAFLGFQTRSTSIRAIAALCLPSWLSFVPTSINGLRVPSLVCLELRLRCRY
jgi:hypothetical protein